MYTYSNFNDKQDLITKPVLILYMTVCFVCSSLVTMLTWWWWPNQIRKAKTCSHLFDTPHNKYSFMFDFYNITLWYMWFSLHFTLSSECGVETNWLVLLREIMAVCCGNCRKHTSADIVAICCFTRILAEGGFVWVWNLVAHTEGGMQAEGV